MTLPELDSLIAKRPPYNNIYMYIPCGKINISLRHRQQGWLVVVGSATDGGCRENVRNNKG